MWPRQKRTWNKDHVVETKKELGDNWEDWDIFGDEVRKIGKRRQQCCGCFMCPMGHARIDNEDEIMLLWTQ